MSNTSVIVEGMVRADGTVEVPGKVDLPSGRVQVMLVPLPELPAGDPFWQTLRAIWDDQAARSHCPRTAEEVRAERQALNEEMARELEQAAAQVPGITVEIRP